MDYYAGLDVSLEETSVCVVDGDGAVVHEATVAGSRSGRWPVRSPRRSIGNRC